MNTKKMSKSSRNFKFGKEIQPITKFFELSGAYMKGFLLSSRRAGFENSAYVTVSDELRKIINDTMIDSLSAGYACNPNNITFQLVRQSLETLDGEIHLFANYQHIIGSKPIASICEKSLREFLEEPNE